MDKTHTRKRILVVDDESDVANMIAEFCSRLGFETRVLNGGEAVLEAVKAFHPDIISLDLLMPGRSGLDVLGELKEDPETRGIPVLVVSSIAGNVSADYVLRSQAQGTLAKPFQLQKLRTAIEHALTPA